jgi:hypothetical protein
MSSEIKVLSFSIGVDVQGPAVDLQSTNTGLGSDFLLVGPQSATLGFDNKVEILEYDYQDEQEAYLIFTIPAGYVAGSQIKLVNGCVVSAGNSDNILIKAETTLIEPNSTIWGTFPNQHISINTELTLSVANRVTPLGDIDLTDISGEINSVAVQSGDALRVRLYRDIANETVTDQNITKVLKNLFSIELA